MKLDGPDPSPPSVIPSPSQIKFPSNSFPYCSLITLHPIMARHGQSKAQRKRPPAVARPSPPRFTMQQEARNTETHLRSWTHSNLRHKAVEFVSAGQLRRNEHEVDQEDAGQKEILDQTPEPQSDRQSEPREDAQDFAFFLDTKPKDVAQTGLPDPTVRADTPESDDSEDEVVFTGRQNNQKPIVIKTDEAELREYLQHPQSSLTNLLGTQNIERHGLHNHISATRFHTMHNNRHKQNLSPEKNIDTEMNHNIKMEHDLVQENSQPHEAEGGTDLGECRAEQELPTQGSEAENHPNQELDETEVQGSIDVLSKMHLDTEIDDETSSGEDEEVDDSGDSNDSEDPDESEGEINDMDDDGLLEELANSFAAGQRGPRYGKHTFPSATAFVDALESDPYYGVDIMDFDRPSLQRRPKGKKAPLFEDLMISDSELELHLQGVWQTDRKKKSIKKQEREVLRSQGLLGRKSGDPDLKVKYAKGMNLEEFISEIRTFLLSPNSSLSLPPMTKHRRKTIHELANKVNLKSQSRGNGPDRFPVLLKTSRTPKYTRKTISQVDNLLSGRKLNRRLFQSWGPESSRPAKPKRGGTGAAVSYMDGDVVGASAPEIGAGNRGRAMLEKMGWSSGTALGANNNKGILQPVAHVVKNSRAGLG
ncbi:hypothetical protein N7478_001492 [Penicillium angulare]|uniref:uncharacterized protein n=1 Tax=Penicillium angulare TaxID=116970 RepID=UPI00254060B0|nr:uncharacterized protein N7478_001492 [Penicillium angulare]KAJ5288462.1 hypothetical protein N7478_001492 [Penicillium angulare]